MSAFKIGDLVAKVGGYPFPGRIIGRAKTSAGAERFNVESTVLPGLIHIFNASQLAPDDGHAAIRVALDTLKRGGVDILPLMQQAHAAMRTCGWQLAPASETRSDDGVFEAALADIEDRFTAALAKLEGR